jgi:molybdenum cofactor guanylyltransferase
MGRDKALMPFLGKPLILRVLQRLESAADEVLLSTNRPKDYAFLNLSMVSDLQPGCGALGGLYSMLKTARQPSLAAVACDMPFVNRELLNYEIELLTQTGADVVIPASPEGLEPLHAVYRREVCMPVVESALQAGKLKMTGWLREVNTRLVTPDECARFDPQGLAFWNLNTPEEFHEAEERARLETG